MPNLRRPKRQPVKSRLRANEAGLEPPAYEQAKTYFFVTAPTIKSVRINCGACKQRAAGIMPAESLANRCRRDAGSTLHVGRDLVTV